MSRHRHHQPVVTSPKAFCYTEAVPVQPESTDPPVHDAFIRFLHHLELNPALLRDEARTMANKNDGLLVLDDSTLDKPCVKKILVASRHWLGKHKREARGSNLITIIWTDGDWVVPCDSRLDDTAEDGLTKNVRFLAKLRQAKARGFEARCAAFDSWYSGREDLKGVRAHGRTFLTQLKVNRKVDPTAGAEPSQRW